jgi:acetoin utilization deacetylase AcuC-like enzyme
MKLFYSDQFRLPLPGSHSFPQPKYALLRERVLSDSRMPPIEMIPAPPAADDQVLLVHDADYLLRLKEGRITEKEMRRIGFPWSPELVARSWQTVGGTIMACRAALEEGLAMNLGGGTHHAFRDHGQGFCVLNDVGIAARVMQQESRARKIVILDCDVHQGNGTAKIFEKDASVFTFSIHGARNFPSHKEQSDLDVALPNGADDRLFLSELQSALELVFTMAQANLAIYIAGADPYEDDRFGRMALTKAGLAERDRMVLSQCRIRKLPVAVVLGGGYARQVEDIVDIHLQTIRTAAELYDQEHHGGVFRRNGET